MTQRSQIFWANWATGEEWGGYNTLCTHAPFRSSKSVLNQGRRKWLHCLAGKSCKTAIRLNNSAVKESPVHEGFHWALHLSSKAWFSACGTAKGKDKLVSHLLSERTLVQSKKVRGLGGQRPKLEKQSPKASVTVKAIHTPPHKTNFHHAFVLEFTRKTTQLWL